MMILCLLFVYVCARAHTSVVFKVYRKEKYELQANTYTNR